MMIFWFCVFGLTLLALAFALLPLWRKPRALAFTSTSTLNVTLVKQQLVELESDLVNGFLDSAQYAEARRDLERELLTDTKTVFATDLRAGRWMATLVTLLVVPLLAMGFYQQVGDTSLVARLIDAQNTEADNTLKEAPSMAILVQRLAERLQKEPNNVDGWLILGRSYLVIGDAVNGLAALERAYALVPKNVLVALTYAEALAQTNDGNLSGRPAKIIETIFESHPNDPNALWMRGMLAFQQGQYAEAVHLWVSLRSLSPNNDKDMVILDELIHKARAKISPDMAALMPSAEVVSPLAPTPPVSPSFLKLRITLADVFKDQLDPEDSLFIFARALEGPPIPVAAYRARAADLPIELELNDSMAVLPSMRLSQFSRVMVSARISKTREAMPKPGDLQGEAGPVTPLQAPETAGSTAPVVILINQVRP